MTIKSIIFSPFTLYTLSMCTALSTTELLLLQNKAWAKRMVEIDKDYFENLLALQAPQCLWIGCSDSRVPANQITDTKPGEIFVHRNIANLVVPGDKNILSVLQYSVQVLKVKHIIVCGHEGCGGIKAAIENNMDGVIQGWLKNIQRVYKKHASVLEAMGEEEKTTRLVELNVMEQVKNLSQMDIIQQVWNNKNVLVLHGWVYSLQNGVIRSICEQTTPLPTTA